VNPLVTLRAELLGEPTRITGVRDGQLVLATHAVEDFHGTQTTTPEPATAPRATAHQLHPNHPRRGRSRSRSGRNPAAGVLASPTRKERKMTTTSMAGFKNGVDVDSILEAREALTQAPEAAHFQWKAQSEWVAGTHTKTTVEKFFGLGAEQNHVERFTFSTDHPEIFASEDHGPTPVEMVLVGLAGCLGAGIATVATNRGIDLRSVKATVTGDMDLQGVLGIDRDVRNGYSAINVRYEIDADASPAEVEAIVAQSQKRSAVYDALTNPTSVQVEVVA
jgi:uncharacterized OsmC-like protein